MVRCDIYLHIKSCYTCSTIILSLGEAKKKIVDSVAPRISEMYRILRRGIADPKVMDGEEVRRLHTNISNVDTYMDQVATLVKCATGAIDVNRFKLFAFGVPPSREWSMATMMAVVEEEMMVHASRVVAGINGYDKDAIFTSIGFLLRSILKFKLALSVVDKNCDNAQLSLDAIHKWLERVRESCPDSI